MEQFIFNLRTRRIGIAIVRTLYKKWVSGISPGEERRPVRTADNLTTFMRRMSRNSGSLSIPEP